MLNRNQFVQVERIVLRSWGSKTGSHCAAALTMNPTSGTDLSHVMACKSAMYRRVTDLTMGAEEHELPMTTGMSSIIIPNNISGRPVYFIINATEGCHSIQLYYRRGAGAIATSEVTVTENASAIA